MKYAIAAAVLLLVGLGTQAQSSLLNGNADAARASGSWAESHEGVSLFCVHATTNVEVTKGNSQAVCFMTEAQAKDKGSVTVATNLYVVQKWDEHGLTATTDFYTDANGNETTASNPNATKVTFRLVLDFSAHTVTKFLEASGKTIGYHLAAK